MNATTVEAAIGPEGRIVTHPSGAKLTIPPEALASVTSITLAGIAPPWSDALGGAQAPFTLVIAPALNPLPVLSSISPTNVDQGSTATSIALTGSSFVPASQALLDGSAVATTFVDARSIPVSTVDTQIAITGTNFIAATSAAIDAQGIPTLFVSDTQLSATIPATYLAAPGTLNIDVYNPTPGGGFSVGHLPIAVTGGADAGSDADAALAPCIGYDGYPYPSGTEFIEQWLSACGALAPGYCKYELCGCNNGSFSAIACIYPHVPADVVIPASTPDCSAFTCSVATMNQVCTAPHDGTGEPLYPTGCRNPGPATQHLFTGKGVFSCNGGGLVFQGGVYADKACP